MADPPNLLYKYLDYAGLLVILYFFITAVAAIYTQGLFGVASYQWIWGLYSPYAYQVLIFCFAYMIGYPKFRWLSPFMFLFVWGFNDMYYNIYFDVYHIQDLIAGQLSSQMPNGLGIYLMKMTVEAVIMSIGAVVLHLKFDLKYSLVKYVGLGLIIINAVFGAVSGLPQLSATTSLIFQLQAASAIIGLLMFMYSSIVPREEPEAIL